MEEEVNRYWDQLHTVLAEFLPGVIGAVIILVVGLWAVKLIVKLTKKILEKREVDKSVSTFLASLIKWGLTVLIFIMVISKLGVPTTSFIAVLGAAGLAVGMALQGSLGNFAGGVLILLFKPFRVGDYINGQGISGTVTAISIFTTSLRTDSNQLAIIPNGQLSNEKIINYSTLERRGDALEFTINHQDNLKVAKDAIMEVLITNPGVIKDDNTKPKVVVSAIADKGVVLQAQYLTKTGEFWPTHFEVIENVKRALDTAGINKILPRQEISILEN